MRLVTAAAKTPDSAEFAEMLRLEILHFCAADFSDENSCGARLYIIDLDSENAFMRDQIRILMKNRSGCGAVLYSRDRQVVDGCVLTEYQACFLRPFAVSEFIREVKRITGLLSDGEKGRDISVQTKKNIYPPAAEFPEGTDYKTDEERKTGSYEAEAVTEGGGRVPDAENDGFELEFFPKNGKVIFRRETVALTKKEYELLYYLYQRRGSPVSRSEAVRDVWHYDFTGNSNIVEVYIRYLRQKLDDRFNVKLIRTVRGCGYIIL